jgi:hypothetical protein
MKKIYKLLIASIVFCSLHTTINAQETKQMSEAEIEGLREGTNNLDLAQKGGLELLELLGNILKAVNSAGELYDAMTALDNNECVPDLTTDASAMMPSGCDEEGACNACYEKAVTSLNHVRKNLARMSCLRINTKTYVESAIAFGDDVSGIHGAMGLAWQNERKGIQAGYEKFKKTYDTKYIEMMQSLEAGLKEINRCEAQFGMKDWYQKAGFIYFEMMKERYKRTD